MYGERSAREDIGSHEEGSKWSDRGDWSSEHERESEQSDSQSARRDESSQPLASSLLRLLLCVLSDSGDVIELANMLHRVDEHALRVAKE